MTAKKGGEMQESHHQQYLRQHFVEREDVAEQLRRIAALSAERDIAVAIHLTGYGDPRIVSPGDPTPIGDLECMVKTAAGARRVSLRDCVSGIVEGLLDTALLFPSVPDAINKQPSYAVEICVAPTGLCTVAFSNTMLVKGDKPLESALIHASENVGVDHLLRLLARCGVSEVTATAAGTPYEASYDYESDDEATGLSVDLRQPKDRVMAASTLGKLKSRVSDAIATLYDYHIGIALGDGFGARLQASVQVEAKEIRMTVYENVQRAEITTVVQQLDITPTVKPRRLERAVAQVAMTPEPGRPNRPPRPNRPR